MSKKIEEQTLSLQEKLEALIKQLMPTCYHCNGNDVRVRNRYESHSRPGPMVFGPGSAGSSWTTVDFEFLYCADCGMVFFSEKIEETLSNLIREIHEKDRELFTRKNRSFL